MNLNYKMIVYGVKTEEGVEYVAKFPALKGVAGGGKTQEEAVKVLLEHAKEYMDDLKEDGYPIPEEDLFEEQKKYSGTFSVRVSPETHKYLAESASDEGLSLNAYINNLFSKDMGEKNAVDVLANFFAKYQKQVIKEQSMYTNQTFKIERQNIMAHQYWKEGKRRHV
jgi:predicted HicB family RNase H-like nuclease